MVRHPADELRTQLDHLSDPAGVLASLLEFSPTPLALYDPSGHCLRVNPAYRTLFGIEPKQLSTGLDLSTEVARNLSQLVDMVVAELKAIGIKVQAKNR